MMELRRKLYQRGHSFEITIPMPLLYSLDKDKKNIAIFKFDKEENKWYVEFEEVFETEGKLKKGK